MYLSKLKLKNFQVHKDTEIEFGPGINVIVGPTDHGKSSIYRALKAGFLNNLNLTRKITHGVKGNCCITSEGEFGTVIRERGKSKNTYVLNGEELKSLGQGSVDEVLKVTNITDINFQSQHDKPFLLDSAGGEVARYLNKIINLEVIDRNLSNLKSAEKEATQEIKHVETQLQEREKDLEKFTHIDSMVANLDEIEKLQCELEDESIAELDELTDKLGDALDVLDIVQEIGTKKIDDINYWLDGLRKSDEEIEELEGLLSEFDELVIIEIDNLLISKMTKYVDLISSSEDDEDELDNLINQLQELNKIDYNKKLKTLKDELHELSPVCPMCKGEWK